MLIKHALKFQDRLFIIADVIKLLCADSCFTQTVPNGMNRKIAVVLLPCKSFFFCCSNYFSIFDDAGSSIMIVARYPKNMHFNSSFSTFHFFQGKDRGMSVMRSL